MPSWLTFIWDTNIFAFFCLFREVRHISSPNFGVTKFPAIFHPNCQPSAKPLAIAHSLWYKSHIWSFLLPISCTAVSYVHFKNFLIIVLQGCPRKWLLCNSSPLWSGSQISCQTICLPGSNLLCLSIEVENFHAVIGGG